MEYAPRGALNNYTKIPFLAWQCKKKQPTWMLGDLLLSSRPFSVSLLKVLKLSNCFLE
jgi:hypothetical protein